MESKKKLRERIEAKDIIIENLRNQVDDLRDELRNLKETKENAKIEKYLNNYNYAILVNTNTNTIKIWNEGRFEKKVRGVDFTTYSEGQMFCVPRLTIKK